MTSQNTLDIHSTYKKPYTKKRNHKSNCNNCNNTVAIAISTPRRCFLGLSRVLGYVIHVNGIRENKQEQKCLHKNSAENESKTMQTLIKERGKRTRTGNKEAAGTGKWRRTRKANASAYLATKWKTWRPGELKARIWKRVKWRQSIIIGKTTNNITKIWAHTEEHFHSRCLAVKL